MAAPVADICLYGNQSWLAMMADGHMLKGERLGASYTETLWDATDAVRTYQYQTVHLAAFGKLGVPGEMVRVFEPTGRRMAIVDLGRAVPYFGDLSWSIAPVYTISVSTLLNAAEQKERS